MADSSFTVGTPYVRQVTEQAFERDAAGAYAKEVELPGHLELVVDVNGAPWVIARRKAPGLLADMQRVNEQQTQTQGSPVEPQAGPGEQPQPAQPQPQG
jgi:hypothetical protein